MIGASLSPAILPPLLGPLDRLPGPMLNVVPRVGLLMLMQERDGVWTDTIGLSIISGTWPNCTVQAIPGGPLESFGPFAESAIVNFANLPEIIDSQFFWGSRGYAFYSSPQHISVVGRILRYLNSDSYVDYIYVGTEQLFVGGEPVAAIFGV